MRKALFILGAAMCASACFAITDNIDGIHGPGPPTLTLSFDGMDQHDDQRFEFKVIDRKNFVQTRGIVYPLKMTVDPLDVPLGEQFKISVPLAVPKGETGYRVDFWADENNSGSYEFDHSWDYRLQDHSWRVLLDDAAPRDAFAKLTHEGDSHGIHFTHHLDFVDLNEFPDPFPDPHPLPKNPSTDTMVDAVVHVDNLGTEGKMVQIRVADLSGHVVGLYRSTSGRGERDAAAPSTQKFTIPGCIEPFGPYDVALYVDANGNNDMRGNGYDDPSKGPGNDLGWRLLHQLAKGNGLDVIFDAADTAKGNVDVGPP